MTASKSRGTTTKTRRPTATTSIIDELLPGFSERSRKGRRNQAKGAEYERDVAKAFRSLGYPNAKREHGQSRDGGDAPDVSGTPFWIECTKGEASIYDKLEQGLQDASTYALRFAEIPAPVIVCSRRNGKRTRHIVTMERELFLRIIKHLESADTKWWRDHL